MKTNKIINGSILIGHGLLAIPAIIVLSKLNFPDILSFSGEEAFPIIQNQPQNLLLGFGIFFVYSLLFLPASAIVSKMVMVNQENKTPFYQYFAIAGGTLRMLWWAVWLTAIPLMTIIYFAKDTTLAQKETLSLIFRILNESLSTISEDVGVNIFSGIWIIIISFNSFKYQTLPKWMGILGLVSGIFYLTSSSELFGFGSIDIVQSLAPPISGIWFTSIGIYLLLTSKNS